MTATTTTTTALFLNDPDNNDVISSCPLLSITEDTLETGVGQPFDNTAMHIPTTEAEQVEFMLPQTQQNAVLAPEHLVLVDWQKNNQ